MAITNALLVRYAEGFHEVTDAASITAHGRKEGFLQLGGVQSVGDVETICEALFVRQAWAQVSTQMAIDPTGNGDVPNIDFRKGSFILAPDETGAIVSQRVRSLTTSIDPETGRLLFVPELRDIVEEETEQLERWLKRLANGALGGSTNTPSPSSGGSGGTQLTAITFAELPPFSYPGAIAEDISGHYRPIAATRIVRWFASLRVAGSSTTSVDLIIDGATVDTIELAASDQYEPAIFEADITIGSVIQVEITAAGSGAEDLLVQIVTGT